MIWKKEWKKWWSLDYKIEYSQEASLSLESIYKYIYYNLSSPSAAASIINGILSSIDSLSTLPYRHRKLDDELFSKKDIRIFNYKNFLILYSIIEKERLILIVNIFYEKYNYQIEGI